MPVGPTARRHSRYAGSVGARGSSGGGAGGGEGVLEGRAALGYDHGYDAEVFYLGLALDPRYVEGFVEGCLERIGENDSEEDFLRGIWAQGDDRGFVLEALKSEVDVRAGRP